MGAQREEEEARRLMKESGATLKRTTGGHEIWLLPNGITFPLRAKGRQPPSTRQWRNVLCKLKRAMRGQEHRLCRQVDIPSATDADVEAAANAIEDEDEDMSDALGQEWNKPKVRRRKTIIEEETTRVSLTLWHLTEAMERLFGVTIPKKHEDLKATIDRSTGDVIVSWIERQERVEGDGQDGEPDDSGAVVSSS